MRFESCYVPYGGYWCTPFCKWQGSFSNLHPIEFAAEIAARTVWFRNESLLPDEEDYEWPACFIINAANERNAQEWGGHLADRYLRSHPNERLLRSEVEPVEKYSKESLAPVPTIEYGYEATDDEIGWGDTQLRVRGRRGEAAHRFLLCPCPPRLNAAVGPQGIERGRRRQQILRSRR